MVTGNRDGTGSTSETEESNEELPAGERPVGRRTFVKAAGLAAGAPLFALTARADSGPQLLEIVSTEATAELNGLSLTYEFTTTGQITPRTDVGRNSAEENDSVTQNDDGTWTATGKTGNGFGDAYEFEGRLLEFSPTEGAFELRLDGNAVTVEDLVSSRAHVVEVLTTEDPSEVSYEFTATGEVQPHTDNGDDSAENNDTITENDDGTWTVSGYTGNGFGDAFYFDGDITDFSPISGPHEVYVDGQQVDLSQFESGPAHDIEVLTTEDPSEVSYQFTTSGEITPNADNGDDSAENNDEITENDDGTWTVEGYTGNGFGDAFHFDGELESFSPVTGPHEVYVDGQQVDLSQFETGPDHVMEVLTTEDPSEVSYEVTTTGEIQPHTDNGDDSAEDNDTITENDDGTWTVSGYTGNGFGDAFFFDGEITDVTPVSGPHEVHVDGQQVDLSQFETPPDHHVEVLTTEDPSEVTYSFTTTGEITPDSDNGDDSAENNDTISQNADGTWTVSGYTGNGFGDAFYFDGELESFSPVTGPHEVYVDGSQIDLSEYERDVAMGGGDGYVNTVPESAATTVVSSAGELDRALSNASSGDVVYVDGDAEIGIGSRQMTVPSGVTLASDRGIDGSQGGLLKTGDDVWPSFVVESGARVTGLRCGGPHWSHIANSDAGIAFRCFGTVEVDNCEVWGFSHAAVRVEGDSHVHHCDIHHNPMDGLGYGVLVKGGHPTVEYSVFDANRHSVASDGSGGYTVRHNHFGATAHGHVIDCHRPGGTDLQIHHNTVEATQLSHKDKKASAVTVRGVPDDTADILQNWFHNPDEPRDAPSGWTDEAIRQVHVDQWTNVEFDSNAYGSSDPGSGVGCPR